MYSAYKLNKQGHHIQPWHTLFPIWKSVCCSMSSSDCCFFICIQTSQEAGNCSGIPISWRIFHRVDAQQCEWVSVMMEWSAHSFFPCFSQLYLEAYSFILSAFHSICFWTCWVQTRLGELMLTASFAGDALPSNLDRANSFHYSHFSSNAIMSATPSLVAFLMGPSVLITSIRGPHSFQHEGSVSWKTAFPQTGGRGWFQDGSSTLHRLYTLFLLLIHQLCLGSLGTRSWRLGTPALSYFTVFTLHLVYLLTCLLSLFSH